MKLLSIVKSPRAGKKWRATFEHTGTVGKTKFHTDFGASGYVDFTQHKDPERARLYRMRHKKDLDTKNPTKAGFLSYYILWASPDFEANVRAYKNRFHL
jgi:hypothetical protein